MRRGTLLPDTAEVELGFLRPKDGTIQMHLRACRASAVCPECRMISSRVHSRYARSSLGGHPGPYLPADSEVLLRQEGLPTAHLHGATSQHGRAICAEDAALLRSPRLDHARAPKFTQPSRPTRNTSAHAPFFIVAKVDTKPLVTKYR